MPTPESSISSITSPVVSRVPVTKTFVSWAGERRRVLQQFGDQVDDVVHGAADEVDDRQFAQSDPFVELHLGSRGGGARR